jgi:glycosyltransferase involved in cell wall biosynthesis
MKKKIVIFIDILAAKNKLQVSAIEKIGFDATFFVYKYNGKSDEFLGTKNSQVLLTKKWLPHIWQVFLFLKKNKKNIHHLEIYSGGALSFIYLLLGKLFGIKSICVERGDLLYFHKAGYSRLVRFSMWFCYKFSSITWYRELYMKPILEKMGTKNLFFLHNAIETKKPCKQGLEKINNKKDITFLWLNRIIPERRWNWFINVLKKEELKNTLNYLVGFKSGGKYSKDQEFIKLNSPGNLIIEEYSDHPSDYFKRAKFFVLPADVVFANHSLLEAMSYGVVPLVSKQAGSGLIVDDRKNGFIFQHDENSFQNTLMEAFNLDDSTYLKYSEEARKKIISDFSEEKYFKGISELYASLALLKV